MIFGTGKQSLLSAVAGFQIRAQRTRSRRTVSQSGPSISLWNERNRNQPAIFSVRDRKEGPSHPKFLQWFEIWGPGKSRMKSLPQISCLWVTPLNRKIFVKCLTDYPVQCVWGKHMEFRVRWLSLSVCIPVTLEMWMKPFEPWYFL